MRMGTFYPGSIFSEPAYAFEFHSRDRDWKMVQALKKFALGLTAMLLAVTASAAAKTPFGILPDGRLDHSAIFKAYKDSEWELVTSTLHGYLRKKGEDETELNDRIFAFKYLGVIYGADSSSHAKSESYFTRLIQLSPNVAINELFPSKRVTDLFQSVKADYQERQRHAQRFDIYGHETGGGASNEGDALSRAASGSPSNSRTTVEKPSKTTSRSTSSLEEKKRPWVWWTLGLAAVGAGVGVYYLANQQEDKPKDITDVGN